MPSSVEQTSIALRASDFRFGPWWVTAISGSITVPLVALAWLAWGGFAGAFVVVIAVTYLVPVCIVAAVAMPFSPRITRWNARSTHSRLAVFRALSFLWVIAWLLTIVALALVDVVLWIVQDGASESTESPFQLSPAAWLYTFPLLVLWLIVSAFVSRRFRPTPR